MGIISGLVAGTILFIAVGIWSNKRQDQWLEPNDDELDSPNTIEAKPTLLLEKKLRDAIYDCERNVLACEAEINTICQNQLDLLDEIGKISHVEVKNKALFFDFYNPISQKRHFYYERDLNSNIDPSVLEDTQKIAQKYTQHIELLTTQKELFERLIHSHQENLQRINGLKKQEGQLDKIEQHRANLNALETNDKLESKAIHNELLITGINEELEHQEECLRQYIELNKKYGNNNNEQVEEKFKIEIQKIIHQLEAEDPNLPT